MNQQEKFMDIINEIKDYAVVNGNVITKEQIREFFQGAAMEIDESRLEMVSGFLAASEVKVEDFDNDFIKEQFEETGFSGGEEEAETVSQDKMVYGNEDREYVKMYLKELEGIEKLDEAALEKALLEGDRKKIIENYLSIVAKQAEKYSDKGVLMGDLIQEGNMGLMEAVEEYEGRSLKELETAITDRVEQYLQAALIEQNGEKNVESKIARRVNELNDKAKEMSEILGRKVKISEIAEKMKVTEEEVKEVLDFCNNNIKYIEL